MAVTRLGLGSLGQVPEACQPLVRPGDAGVGIVHLGLGAFHRAHQAVYTERALAAQGGDWGIIAVAPRSTGMVRALSEQDGLFSVVSIDNSDAKAQVVGAFAGVRHAASDPAAVVALLADPRVRVVTLTVTEKAYQLDAASGQLRADADLTGDLCTDRPPVTVPGLIVRGLLARARADAGPIALLSCDNLPSNGVRLAGVVEAGLGLAGAAPAALRWVSDQVTFPSTMVDRIVPATTAETRARARSLLGVTDEATVSAEPFMQWVIEDRFPGGRPAWDAAGAMLTDDAGPWERLKLRALNGVHSALAYLGALAGAETIAETLAIDGMAEAMRRLVAEDIAPSLVPPAGADVLAYGASVLDRFGNAAIGHRTLQVAMDGSQKLPQRVLHTIIDRREAGGTPRWAALVVAAWMRYVQGRADDGTALPLDDPLAETIRKALASEGDVVTALLGIDQVFPAAFADDDQLRSLIDGWLGELTRHGVRATVAAAVRA